MSDFDALLNYASSITTLKQQGNRHYGICPIPSHQEKTGSFIIDEATGRWKCYGCHASGSDAIYLYMEIHGCEWREAKKSLGLWDDNRVAPKPRPKQPPKKFESDNRRDCYRIARETLIKMWDCEITHQGSTVWNHEFILQALAGHAKRDQYIEKICIDIAERANVNPWTFITLFVNEAYEETSHEKI